MSMNSYLKEDRPTRQLTNFLTNATVDVLHLDDMTDSAKTSLRDCCQGAWDAAKAWLDSQDPENDAALFDILLAGSWACGYARDDAAMISDFDLVFIVNAQPMTANIPNLIEFKNRLRTKLANDLFVAGFRQKMQAALGVWYDIADRTNYRNKVTNQIGSRDDVTAISLLDSESFKTAQDARAHYVSKGLISE